MPLAPLTTTRHRTKQEFVYRTLREAILRCDLQPGERLVIDDLARRLNVSIIPVREALQLLQAESLVVMVPHVGTTVAPVSRESILDVFLVLEGLEVVATRLVAERSKPEDLQVLADHVAAMDAALVAGQHEEWAALNRRFHLAISELPGLELLKELTARVLDRWDRLRRYYFRDVLSHRMEQAQQEHRDILAAARARDLPRLADLVRRHNQAALSAYMSYLAERPADGVTGR
jgi:DNA-binding GntR family transcriptional regulator